MNEISVLSTLFKILSSIVFTLFLLPATSQAPGAGGAGSSYKPLSSDDAANFQQVQLQLLITISSLMTMNFFASRILLPIQIADSIEDSSSSSSKDSPTSSISSTLYISLVNFLLQTIGFYVLLVLFGAPLFIWQEKTLYLSAYLATLLFPFHNGGKLISLPFNIESGGHLKKNLASRKGAWNEDKLSTRILGWTFLGCWISAFILPLDWQKEYQKWPTPIVYGGLTGNVAGQSFALFGL